MTDGPSNRSEQAIDPELNARMAALIASLDLAAEFDADGSQYSELDELGRVVVHLPGGEMVLWQEPDGSP